VRVCSPLGAVALGWLLGCSTTAATIHGPQLSVGLELDHDIRLSPRIELGYDYFYWKDMIGAGAAAGLAYASVNNRLSIFGEGLFNAFPLPPFPLTPLAVGGELSLKAGEFAPAIRVGLSTVAYMPPKACYPPLEGDWEGCPSGHGLTRM